MASTESAMSCTCLLFVTVEKYKKINTRFAKYDIEIGQHIRWMKAAVYMILSLLPDDSSLLDKRTPVVVDLYFMRLIMSGLLTGSVHLSSIQMDVQMEREAYKALLVQDEGGGVSVKYPEDDDLDPEDPRECLEMVSRKYLASQKPKEESDKNTASFEGKNPENTILTRSRKDAETQVESGDVFELSEQTPDDVTQEEKREWPGGARPKTSNKAYFAGVEDSGTLTKSQRKRQNKKNKKLAEALAQSEKNKSISCWEEEIISERHYEALELEGMSSYRDLRHCLVKMHQPFQKFLDTTNQEQQVIVRDTILMAMKGCLPGYVTPPGF